MASAEKIGKMVAVIRTLYPYYAKDVDSETLAKTWMMLLRDLPDEVATMAMTQCLRTHNTPPTPADVLEAVKEMAASCEPTDEEMWIELTEAVKATQEYAYNFNYTFVEDNGKTQGENAREKFANLWNGLPEKLKEYLGGKSELLRLAKFNTEEMYFEKKQFLKTLPQIKRSVTADVARLCEQERKRLCE